MKAGEIATEAQFRYACQIADRLGISVPQEFTKQAYFEFIRDNQGKYQVESQRMSDEDYGFDEGDY